MRKLLAALCSALTLHAFVPSGVVVGSVVAGSVVAGSAIVATTGQADARQSRGGGRSSVSSRGRSGGRSAGRSSSRPSSRSSGQRASRPSGQRSRSSTQGRDHRASRDVNHGQNAKGQRKKNSDRNVDRNRDVNRDRNVNRDIDRDVDIDGDWNDWIADGFWAGAATRRRGGRVVRLFSGAVLQQYDHRRSHLSGLQRRLVCAPLFRVGRRLRGRGRSALAAPAGN